MITRKKIIFKYEMQKILFALSVIFVISVFIIIVDCDLPIVKIHPSIDPWIEKIFISKHEDNTFYNIAISYVAAYIFFILQVYIPANANHKKGMGLLKEEIEVYLNHILMLLTILSEITVYTNGKIAIEPKEKIYIVENKKCQIRCITFEKTFRQLIEIIEEKHSKLFSNPLIGWLDRTLCESLCAIQIKNIISLSLNIYMQVQSEKKVPIIGENVIENGRKVINDIQRKYKFEIEDYIATNDNIKISEYCTGAVNIAMHTSNELEITVRLKK